MRLYLRRSSVKFVRLPDLGLADRGAFWHLGEATCCEIYKERSPEPGDLAQGDEVLSNSEAELRRCQGSVLCGWVLGGSGRTGGVAGGFEQVKALW